MRIIGIILAIFGFLVLVVGHELGHFSAGKLLDFRISEFSVGIGPCLFQRQKGETKYSLRAIPLGGYCAFDLPPDEDELSDDESNIGDKINDILSDKDNRAFSNQPAWAKIAVLLAGPFMNIIIGILMFALIFCYVGIGSRTLEYVDPNGPAYAAGIRSGDTILGVNNREYNDFESIQGAISAFDGDVIPVRYERDGKIIDTQCGFYINEYGSRAVGIQAKITKNFGDCLNHGIKETGVMLVSIRDFFVDLFKGNASSDDLTSVVGIVSMAGDSAEHGLINVFYLIALVSANLGYMNLLPFPALDGGRILITIIKALSGN